MSEGEVCGRAERREQDRYLGREIKEEGKKERDRGLHTHQVISPLAAFHHVSL